MLKTLRCSSLVLAASLVLGGMVPAAPAAPAFLAHAPALFGQPTSFQCAQLPVDCCQAVFNGHCWNCIREDPTCSLP